MKQSVEQQATASHIPGLGVIVMAAGLGKRMKSNQVKVLHHVAGQPMVLYAVDVALQLAGHRIAVVVGHQSDRVRQVIEVDIAGRPGSKSVRIVEQAEQLGTGHAVMQSRPAFCQDDEPSPTNYLILNGDTPLLKEETVRELLRAHLMRSATVTILTAILDDPSGYGRVIRRQSGGDHQGVITPSDVLKVVEDRDATPVERATQEINVGTYVVSGEFLFDALDKLEPRNAQNEYYLTDIVRMAVAQERPVAAVTLQDPEEGLGVNTRQQLAAAEQVVREQIRDRWLEAGVTMRDPGSVWIDAGVTIGRDTVLYPHVSLEGKTSVGEGTTIRSGVRISDCMIGNHVEILDHCVLRESQIDDDAHLGPFAHLRPGAILRRKAKVGNFVEMKKAELGEGSKASHLTYLGDARIGKGVNIGAGTITVNYDGGVKKHQTVIDDYAFVGSDSQIIAPITIGQGAIIAAGTTITQNVPADSLAIARVPQVNRVGWAAKRRMLLTTGTPSENSAKVSDKQGGQSAKKTSSNMKNRRTKSLKR
ncbi:MAG TPA: bifunctional UDP-N-acetylglucosamine diphosphorylase/glucosamine-1-phosphate N-acetyltransferase GlmU [Nitrospira sp.]|nr:bifunctional UDP-N-acetylglucosamine diphosphorylase/glucosamine-1-phosphate N-acetyltransferase GlmU [Nitrospira sp.]